MGKVFSIIADERPLKISSNVLTLSLLSTLKYSVAFLKIFATLLP